MKPSLSPVSNIDRLAWLKRLNASLSQWAATLSWARMAALALIVMVAGSWIASKLQLSHEKESEIKVRRLPKAQGEPTGTAQACEGDEIRIGGKGGIVICEGRRTGQATAPPPFMPATGASAAALPAATA